MSGGVCAQHIHTSNVLVSRGGTAEVSPIQSRQDTELVEEKGACLDLQCLIIQKPHKE